MRASVRHGGESQTSDHEVPSLLRDAGRSTVDRMPLRHGKILLERVPSRRAGGSRRSLRGRMRQRRSLDRDYSRNPRPRDSHSAQGSRRVEARHQAASAIYRSGLARSVEGHEKGRRAPPRGRSTGVHRGRVRGARRGRRVDGVFGRRWKHVYRKETGWAKAGGAVRLARDFHNGRVRGGVGAVPRRVDAESLLRAELLRQLPGSRDEDPQHGEGAKRGATLHFLRAGCGRRSARRPKKPTERCLRIRVQVRRMRRS